MQTEHMERGMTRGQARRGEARHRQLRHSLQGHIFLQGQEANNVVFCLSSCVCLPSRGESRAPESEQQNNNAIRVHGQAEIAVPGRSIKKIHHRQGRKQRTV